MEPLSIPRAQWRVLSFRFTGEDLARLERRHLVYGLAVTWAVGMGRYWDHPGPYLFQALGLGSLLVMGALGLFLFLVLRPLRPANWSLLNLYTFLSLTALPALLYAIPVERFLSLEDAATTNIWFLLTVAAWRVALLARYLRERTDLSTPAAVLALLLPLALIVATLTVLNLEQAVFSVMAGLEQEATPNDAAYEVLVLLTAGSVMLSPILIGLYGVLIWQRRSAPERET